MSGTLLRMTAIDSAAGVRGMAQKAGLVGGPLLALVVFLLLPESFVSHGGGAIEFTAAGRATLAIMVWMGVWWLTEAIDIAATALLPIAVFPVLGIASIGAATAPYASDFIFLFMGGFILALSMQRWGLDRRIALITLRFVGTRPAFMLGGFMLVTAAISMWVSNTATAAMMMPIALSVIDLVLKEGRSSATSLPLPSQGGGQGVGRSPEVRKSLHPHPSPPPQRGGGSEHDHRNFALCLMLGIAYAASIGGLGTIVGSPPNVILVNFIEKQYDYTISFGQWMLIGSGFVIVLLPVTWLLLRVLFPVRMKEIEGGRALIEREYRSLGPMKPGEWATFIVFICTAVLWIVRPYLQKISFGDGADSLAPFAGLSDAGIAIMASLILFLIPVSRRPVVFTMNWATAERLPWGILILFGGGLSLAEAISDNGVAEFIGAQAGAFAGLPDVAIILIVVTIIIFLSELASNTATAATMVPVLAAMALPLGVDPYLLIFAATIAASCSFMLPVGTPPNAIVFGTGHVTIPQMAKAGVWLDIIGIVVITVLSMTLLRMLLPAG